MRQAVAAGTPLLGVCVGFQLLFDESEESPGVSGLGVLPGTVCRLAGDVKLPQMQWNVLDRTPGTESVLLSGAAPKPWFYFVHSYAPVPDEAIAHSVVGDLRLRGAGRRRRRARHPATGPSSTRRSPADAGLALLAAFAAPLRGRTRRRDLRWSASPRSTSAAVRRCGSCRGEFANETVFGDPLDQAEAFVDAGARRLHVVDLDAARTGEPVNRRAVLELIARAGVPVAGRRGGADGRVGDRAARGRCRPGRRRDGGSRTTRRFVAGLVDALPGRVLVGLDHRRVCVAGRQVRELAVRGWEESRASSCSSCARHARRSCRSPG